MTIGKRKALFLEPEVFSKWISREAEARFSIVDEPASAEVLFIRVGYRIDSELLRQMRSLRVIVSPTTGIDHIDLAECHRRHIDVLTLKNEMAFLKNLTNTSELAFALLLSLFRSVVPAYNDVLAGHWRQAPHRGRTLSGRTFGIVGYGRLGCIAARIARGFGMVVLAYDPYLTVADNEVVQVDKLDELAKRVDVLSLHADLNERSHNMIDAGILGCMSKEAVLINTARGQLVDETALLTALEERAIAGAGLDVIRCETTFGEKNALLEYARTHDNLLLTPHIGGQTEEAVAAADKYILSKLDRWCAENDS